MAENFAGKDIIPATNNLITPLDDLETEVLHTDRPISQTEFEVRLANKVAFLLKDLPGWNEQREHNKFFFQKLPLADTVPTCTGHSCPMASKCPFLKKVVKDGGDGLHLLMGQECRWLIDYGAELFAETVRSRNIDPTDVNEVLLVAQLVSAFVQKRQFEIHLAVDGVIIDEIAIVSKNDVPYDKKVVHPAQKAIVDIDRQIERINGQLMATRKDRLQAVKTQAKQFDLAQAMMQALSTGKTSTGGKPSIND